MNARFLPIVAAAVIAATAAAPAQGRYNTTDKQFVTQAAASGTQEVREGRGESKSSNADARMFGQRMVRDHTKANMQLESAARSAGLTSALRAGIASAPPAQTTQPAKQYLSSQVSAHQTAIALFEREAAQGQNPQLKAFARATLPVLKTHLELAQRLSGTP